MAFTLKEYQKNTLSALRNYLEASRLLDPKAAFEICVEPVNGRKPAYREIQGFENVPYVCLRVPTGGGKTILAAYSIEIAAKSYLEQDFPVVLWLTPTSTIRDQTLEAMKNRSHPYRVALDDSFEGRVKVFNITEIENIRPKDLTDSVCVVVSTLAAPRVEATETRKLYDHNENFEPHFSAVPESTPGLERDDKTGAIKYSFANLMHLKKPLVIMDEAHNARTRLTFESLKRVNPACIIEFTATPAHDSQTGSNILFRVSAGELKAENMIKMPIVLTEHKTWEDTVHSAVRTRQRLAECAMQEQDFVRPLVLLQAESKDKPVNVEALKQHLIENEKISPEKIAIATGDQRELDGINLFDPNNKIEYIITVQALKEGWDCSFAYVFCSVANIRSATAVEQLLGRVMRMPYAQRRVTAELNKSFAHVVSSSFSEAAQALRDNLVSKMGFEQEELQDLVEPAPTLFDGSDDNDAGPLFRQQAEPQKPLVITFAESPTLNLTAEEISQVEIRPTPAGLVEVVVTGKVSPELAKKIVNATPRREREEVRQTVKTHIELLQRKLTPAQRGEKFEVPRLCLWVQGELELAEKEIFLDANGWSLLDFSPDLPAFHFNPDTQTYEFDFKGERVTYQVIGQAAEQLILSGVAVGWDQNNLANWLNKQVRQIDINQPVLLKWLNLAINHLIREKRFDLATLVRAKFILVRAIEDRIKEYKKQAYAKGYQDSLFGPQAAVETSFEFAFKYDPNNYPAKWRYQATQGYEFTKHFYGLPGELDSDGEEFECAKAIDWLPEVKYWVRNLARQEIASFWLPTSTDKFYPDFAAHLNDGRLLVVEYKGDPYKTNDDSREKNSLGLLWEEKSSGKGLFLMAEKRDSLGRGVYQQLADKIR